MDAAKLVLNKEKIELSAWETVPKLEAFSRDYIQHTAGFFTYGTGVAGHVKYWTFRGKPDMATFVKNAPMKRKGG